MADFTLQDQWNFAKLADSGPRGAAADYEHDRVTIEDLLLLGIRNADPVSDHQVVGSDPSLLVTDSDESEPVVHVLSDISRYETDRDDGTQASALETPRLDPASTPQPSFLPFDDEEDGFVEDWSEREQSDVLWHAHVPEPEDRLAATGAVEFPTGVLATERAMQQALAFLQEEGLDSARNLDLLTDIILERGWSSVQTQVRALVRAGYSVDQLHLMFQITGVWLHCVQSDILAPDGWHGGHRLTWQQAARLLDVMGYDATIEEIADFLSAEQDIWSQLRRRSGELATFRDYLFRYRLSTHTQVDDGIWQSNLDPTDERSFDGTRHSLYSSDWWDEPTGNREPELPSLLRASYDLTHITEKLGLDFGVHI